MPAAVALERDVDGLTVVTSNGGVMEAVLWYVLGSSRGGPNRSRILRALDDEPRNANQLAESLDLDYMTVRHHLDFLMKNNVLTKSGNDYGAVYLPSDLCRQHWDTVEEILARMGV